MSVIEPATVSGAGCHWCRSRATGWLKAPSTGTSWVWFTACDYHRGAQDAERPSTAPSPLFEGETPE